MIKRYDSDSVLAVAVLSIDYGYTWHTSSLFGGGSQTHSGCALSLVLLNRTKKPITDFDVGNCSCLVDDQGYQYSPHDSSFYRINTDNSFSKHGSFLVPDSKIEGVILFPQLKKDSSSFVRWFLRGRFWIEKELQEKNFDISLV